MTMKTELLKVDADWKLVKNLCRSTVNKEFTDKEPSDEFKIKLLVSEHSPIRLISVVWSWEDIYSWVATHWSRHKFEKFISTQRDDRVDGHVFDDFDPVWMDKDGNEHHPYKTRNDAPQGALVRFCGFANAQNLIDAFRKRLCCQASPETRELAEDFKMVLSWNQPELARVLVPNCVYRCGCPEFEMCKEHTFVKFVNYFIRKTGLERGALLDIGRRYEWYESYLYHEKFEEGNGTD